MRWRTVQRNEDMRHHLVTVVLYSIQLECTGAEHAVSLPSACAPNRLGAGSDVRARMCIKIDA